MKTRKGLRAGAQWLVAGSSVSIAASVIAMLMQGCGSSRPEASGGGATTQGVILTGPCTVDGATSTCHVETGRSGSIVNCFSGVQTCHAGVWGVCGESGATIKSIDLSQMQTNQSGGGLSPQAVSLEVPSRTAAACTSNPCNPDCFGVDVDAGAMKPEAGFTQTIILGSTIGLGSFPTAKLNAQGSSCTVGAPPANYHGCSYDYCCGATAPATTGTCVQSVADAAAASCTPTAGVDYTAGIGCQDANGVTHIPVCNRGSADSPTTGKLFLGGYPGNLNGSGSSAVCSNLGNNPPEGCLIDLSVMPIKAGMCFDIDVAAAAAGTVPGVRCANASDFETGNRSSQINPPAPTNLPNALRAGYGATAYTQLPETNSCNNQSFVFTQFGSCATYGTQPPPPESSTFTYTSSCLPGFRAEWSQFAYSTSVPANSQVMFKARTAPETSDGGVGAWTSPVMVADIKSASGDPAICTIAGSPTGCPKKLDTLLGIPAKYSPTLEISVGMVSITAIPTVYSWQVSYSCVPYE